MMREAGLRSSSWCCRLGSWLVFSSWVIQLLSGRGNGELVYLSRTFPMQTSSSPIGHVHENTHRTGRRFTAFRLIPSCDHVVSEAMVTAHTPSSLEARKEDPAHKPVTYPRGQFGRPGKAHEQLRSKQPVEILRLCGASVTSNGPSHRTLATQGGYDTKCLGLYPTRIGQPCGRRRTAAHGWRRFLWIVAAKLIIDPYRVGQYSTDLVIYSEEASLVGRPAAAALGGRR